MLKDSAQDYFGDGRARRLREWCLGNGSKWCNGFSLVELLVALLLGTMVVVAGIQLLMTNSETYRLQNGMSDVQENGRFAIEYMMRDIRMAGFGMDAIDGGACGSAAFITDGSQPSAIRFGANESLEGEDWMISSACGDETHTRAVTCIC